MSGTPSTVRVICLNHQVAKSLGDAAIGVFPEGERLPYPPVYDLAPAIYLHAPRLIIAEVPAAGNSWDLRPDAELRARFHQAMKQAGVAGPPYVPRLMELLPDLWRSIAAGHILGVVFAEKVAVDDRLALLPWRAWRDAGHPRNRLATSSLSRWKDTWRVPPDQLTLSPSLEYTPDLLKDLLPVLPPPTSWTRPVAGQTPSVESLRRERISRRQSDLSGGRPPGFHFKVPGAPMEALAVKDGPRWAASLLPREGLRVHVVIQPRNCDSAPKETVQQTVAKSYKVDPSAVQIVPLFVNRLGDWLGVAVHIGKGVILILPEFPDKAPVVKRLATDLWQPIQEWVAAFSAPSKVQGHAGPLTRTNPLRKTETAPANPNTAQEPDLEIARAVDALIADRERGAENLKRFREQIEIFKDELVGRLPQEGPFRPGRNPSLATMFALLAYCHDGRLPDSPAIFDPPIAVPYEVFANTDPSRRTLWAACSGFFNTGRKNHKTLTATLEAYLKRVSNWLDEQAAGPEHKTMSGILPKDYVPKAGEDWYIPMAMAEIARRLELDARTAQDHLAKTGLWRLSRQQWQVRLDTLPPNMRKKVTTEPKKNAE